MRLVSCYFNSSYPFNALCESSICTEDIEDFESGDLLVIWGGSDISPSLYNKPNNGLTWAGERPSKRDVYEWHWLQKAIEQGVPIVGVCRGAQMLCAAAGGHLIQHVDHHAVERHEITTKDGEKLTVNSIHHQMMWPFKVDHELVAWAEQISPVHMDVDDDGVAVNVEMDKEPELVVFPKIKGIAVQWHPEGMRVESPATQLVFNTIKQVTNAV